MDLLAAVPSIVYGLWAALTFRSLIVPVEGGLQDVLGWFPLFSPTGISGGTIFFIGIVLAIMVLPIVTALSREVFDQTPVTHKEGALALGATRWEMIRTAVLPFGQPGVISASMLALGRALGETIAVTFLVSKLADNTPWTFSVFNGGETFASRIANNAAEFDTPAKTGALHRRRPGPVRPDLRRQRDRPGRHRAEEGLQRMTTQPVSAAESPVHDRDGAAPALRKFEVRTAPTAAPPTDSAPRPSTPLDLGHKSRGRAVKDVIARIVMWGSFFLAMVPLVWILFTVISKGVSLLLQSSWWTNSQRNINSTDVGGGAIHAIQGTLIQAGVTAVIAVPIGVLTAIYLVEYGRGAVARAVSFMVDILTGVPSIVAALFIYAVWVTTFGFQRVGLRGLPRARPADAAGRRPVHRGDAQARPERAARGLLRARRAQVGDDRPDRAADRVLRHRHGHPARAGPDHRGDGSAAHPRRRTPRASRRTSSPGPCRRCPR